MGWDLQHVVRLGFVLWVAFFSAKSDAKIRYILDFDGTIVNDIGENAGWRTAWRLKRVDDLHTSLQLNPNQTQNMQYEGRNVSITSPQFLELSYGEYKKYVAKLAKGNGLLGSLLPEPLESDRYLGKRPQLFIPGFYRVSDDTYYRFRPGLNGENYPLEDYSAAKARYKASRGRLKWKGPAFALLQAALKTPNEVDSLVLFTARAHLDEEYLALLSAWKRDGEIANAEGKNERGRIVPRFHSLASPDAILLNGKSITERKVGVVTLESQQLLTGPFEQHEELVTDARAAADGQKAMLHTVIVAENDPRHIVPVTLKLEELSRELHFTQRLKFVLFNAAEATDLKSFRYPWRWTVFDRGFGRPALIEEVQLWLKTRSKTTCAGTMEAEADLGGN